MGLPQGDKSKRQYLNCHDKQIHKNVALLAADKLFCFCHMSPEEPRKVSMFNMVCRWPRGLFGCPVGYKYSQFHLVAKKYVFVHITIGRLKEIIARHNFFH